MAHTLAPANRADLPTSPLNRALALDLRRTPKHPSSRCRVTRTIDIDLARVVFDGAAHIVVSCRRTGYAIRQDGELVDSVDTVQAARSCLHLLTWPAPIL